MFMIRLAAEIQLDFLTFANVVVLELVAISVQPRSGPQQPKTEANFITGLP